MLKRIHSQLLDPQGEYVVVGKRDFERVVNLAKSMGVHGRFQALNIKHAPVKIHAQLEYGSGWFSRNETTRAHYYRKDGVVSLCGLGRRDVTAVHPADADQLRCRHCEIKKRGSR